MPQHPYIGTNAARRTVVPGCDRERRARGAEARIDRVPAIEMPERRGGGPNDPGFIPRNRPNKREAVGFRRRLLAFLQIQRWWSGAAR
jgi:hypothetical protein